MEEEVGWDGNSVSDCFESREKDGLQLVNFQPRQRTKIKPVIARNQLQPRNRMRG